MEMLAAIDKDATKLDIDEKLEAMNHQMEDISQKIEARAQVGARPLPTLQKTLEQREVAIHELQHKHQILQQILSDGRRCCNVWESYSGEQNNGLGVCSISRTCSRVIFQTQCDFSCSPRSNVFAIQPRTRHPCPRRNATGQIW